MRLLVNQQCAIFIFLYIERQFRFPESNLGELTELILTFIPKEESFFKKVSQGFAEVFTHSPEELTNSSCSNKLITSLTTYNFNESIVFTESKSNDPTGNNVTRSKKR